jgi:SNF2 family DNA or RNA helicase
MHAKVTEGIANKGVGQSHILVLDALLKLRQVCCDPRLLRSGSFGTTSSKLDDLLEMVSEMISEGRRILLFSQFTSMLDLIKPKLADANIPFVELRGDTADRAEPVRSFEAGEVPLFLISLKAGGRGLNLTSADTVIHYDPWWNPAIEDQASDRAHRIGQTKSVFVYKLIAADTVEERIVELQERKAALATLALSDEGMALPAMDAGDIDYLFGVTPDLLAA